MERLTERHYKANDGYYMKCSETCHIDCGEKSYCEEVDNVVDRLGAIEDILGDDYDLGRLRELVEADRDGRCVVLPCKEGDKLRRDGTEFTADHWNLILTAFADDKSTKSGKRVGLFGAKEAEAALKPAKEAGVTNDALDPDPSIVGRNKSWIMGRFLKEE